MPRNEPPFPYVNEGDSQGHPKEDINQIMVVGIDGRQADTQGKDTQDPPDENRYLSDKGIDESTEAIGAMQRGNGSENVGIAAIEIVEQVDTKQLVKTVQAGFVAQRIVYGFGSVLLKIPWGSCRMQVVADKTQ